MLIFIKLEQAQLKVSISNSINYEESLAHGTQPGELEVQLHAFDFNKIFNLI